MRAMGLREHCADQLFAASEMMQDRLVGDHPIARDLAKQIRDVVRPEESRHVLIWRYVFHQLAAPKGPSCFPEYMQATNAGRRQLAVPAFDRESLERMLGTGAPTPRQLLGKERTLQS
jgi:hypothetical protein